MALTDNTRFFFTSICSQETQGGFHSHVRGMIPRQEGLRPKYNHSSLSVLLRADFVSVSAQLLVLCCRLVTESK